MRSSSAPFLFVGTVLAASGYGATFLLSAYFHASGGTDLDTGRTLGAAMVGTLFGVPLVGWLSGRYDPARMTVLACCAVAAGFLLLASGTGLAPTHPSGFLVGLGWGMFYVGAPMALSERIADDARAFWFTRFGAFQMAGIGGGPIVLDLVVNQAHLPVRTTFWFVGLACILAAASLWAFASLAPGAARTGGLRAWVRPIAVIARGPSARPILMVGFGACVFSGLLTFQSTLVAGTGANAGTFFAGYAVTVVGARLALARLLAAMPQRPLAIGLLASMLLGVVAMFGVGINPGFQILSSVLTGIGYGLVYTVIQTWAVNDTPPHLRHAALTWFVMSYFVGVFGFPMLGGWLLVHFGRGAFLTALVVAAGVELLLSFPAPAVCHTAQAPR